jgi:hypothetical protein
MHSGLAVFTRAARALIASAALLAVTTTSVAAQQPDMSPAPLGSFDIVGSCPFTVHFNATVDGETLRIFFDRNGNIRLYQYTGPLVAQLTNAATGKSVTINVSGPAKLIDNGDGTISYSAWGVSVYWSYAGDALGAGMWYTHGPLYFLIATGGSNPVASLPSQSLDVCAMLA